MLDLSLILTLAKRVEASAAGHTAEDFDLNRQIAIAMGWTFEVTGRDDETWNDPDGNYGPHVPFFIHRTDDAMRLVPKGWRFILDKRPYAEGRADGYRAIVWSEPVAPYGDGSGIWLSAPALALSCAALLAVGSQVTP